MSKTVKVIEMNGLLRIFSENKEIALHSMQTSEKGKFLTDINHYPHSKNITTNEILSSQREEMKALGDEALEFFETYLSVDVKNRKYDYRSSSGILALRKKYTSDAINNACIRALIFKALNYKTVKNILDKGIDTTNIPSKSYVNQTKIISGRNLSDYNKFLYERNKK